MQTQEYIPTGPYILQSGMYKGQPLELLMFNSYRHLVRILEHIGNTRKPQKSELHLHLEWLIRLGEIVTPRMSCPYCLSKPVKSFSVTQYAYSRRDFAVDLCHTYCPDCEKKISGEVLVYPIRFSTLRYFHSNPKMIARLFKQVLGLPCPLTAKKAFEFFKAIEPYSE